MNTKRFAGTVITAFIAALIAVWAYAKFFQPEEKIVTVPTEQKLLYTDLKESSQNFSFDFTTAAEKAVHAVVHVKTKAVREGYSYNPFYEFFFGDRAPMQQQPVMGFGSGVIISADGYVITNNHVIEGMDEIEVVLNDRRSLPAEVVGTDPSTDLALLKIKATDLPYLVYGNSDDLKLGQWVLAVGNPYNLTSTVTAGIVSAKARNIGILQDQAPIESFIQTDAAVNPGNSGGALVNTSGELVGINTAIASRTGSYSGNSFAIPVSIVKKVIADLTEFGVVQRAILGVTIEDVTQELANKEKIEKLEGVYINGVRESGAAQEAGLKTGDIILKVNNIPVNSVSDLQEQISKYRPKDKVNVLIKRDGKEKQYEVVLRNMSGSTDIVKKDEAIAQLGASFEPAGASDLKRLKINHGVKVTSLKAGKLMKAGVREGFIITRINNTPIKTVEDIKNVLSRLEGGVYVEGVYPDGLVAYYAFGL
jgi:Do/DeqQ family serine protease